MKKKKIGVPVLAAVLALAVIGTSCAVFSTRIAGFFGLHWNRELGEKIEEGKIAQIGEKVVVGGVEFILEEIAYRDRGLYGIGTIRAVDEKDVLVPLNKWTDGEYFTTEEGKTASEKANASGGRLLVPYCMPTEIGVDRGAMMNLGNVSFYDEANGDGSVTCSFEALDGFVVNEGTSYQIQIESTVWETDGTGEYIDGTMRRTDWTVSCVPVMSGGTDKPAAPEQEAPVKGLEDYEVVTPAAYRETGTLPVYRAAETDMTVTADPAWFNTSGIRGKETGKGPTPCVEVIYEDSAMLDVLKEWTWYGEYTEPGRPTALGSLIDNFPRVDRSADPGLFTPGDTVLPGITAEEARSQAEEMIARLGLDSNEYVLTYQLDMTQERIRGIGALYSEQVVWKYADGTEEEPYDYDAIPASEEGYYLEYRPAEIDTEDCRERYGARFYINSRGMIYASVKNEYSRGEIARTPEKLISAEEAVNRLAQELSRSWTDPAQEISSVERVVLTYEAIRAGKPGEGMVFAPAWTVLFREPDMEEAGQDPLCAIFNAEDGSLIEASFR